MEIITLNKPKEEEKEEQNAHKKTTVKEAKVFTIKKTAEKSTKNIQPFQQEEVFGNKNRKARRPGMLALHIL